MQRAKALRKNISRPKLAQSKLKQIRALKHEGLSMNQVSIRSGVAYGTVYNYLAKIKLKPQTDIFRPITIRTSFSTGQKSHTIRFVVE